MNSVCGLDPKTKIPFVFGGEGAKTMEVLDTDKGKTLLFLSLGYTCTLIIFTPGVWHTVLGSRDVSLAFGNTVDGACLVAASKGSLILFGGKDAKGNKPGGVFQYVSGKGKMF